MGRPRVRMDPATTTRILFPVSKLTTFITPEEHLFVLGHMGIAHVDAGTWALRIEGAVERPLTLRYEELRRLPSRAIVAFHECYGNPIEPDVPTRRIGNVVWRGVPLSDVVLDARPRPEARHVWLEGADHGTFANVSSDRYVKDLPLEDVLRGDVLLAYELNGAPLSDEHGFPLRAVVPGCFGTNSVKWLTRVYLAETRPESLFTTRLYNRKVFVDGGTVQEPVRAVDVHSVIVWPSADDALTLGTHAIVGWAWSAHGVERVDVSTDGGSSWEQAQLDRCEHRYAWQRFVFQWPALEAGRYELQCRATDARHRVQPAAGRNRIHAVGVTVARGEERPNHPALEGSGGTRP